MVVAAIGLFAIAIYVVLAAFGVVIPPLGRLLGTEGEGAGTFFGRLLIACLWVGVGLGTLMSAQADRAEQRTMAARSASLTPTTPVVPLPAGPGMVWRWVTAVPVMLLAVVGPWLGAGVVSLWWRRDFFSGFTGDRPFWSEFAESVGDTWPTAAISCVTITIYALLRGGTIATWPKACVILSLPSIVPMLLRALESQDRSWQDLPAVLFCAGLVWASWEFGQAAVGLLTRPIAMDVVRSPAEIPVPLPEQTARLRVQSTELVLDRPLFYLLSEQDKKSSTMALAEVTSIGLTEVAEPRMYPLSDVVWLNLPAGSALRVEAGGTEWLVPVDEVTGQYLVAAITDRAARLRKH